MLPRSADLLVLAGEFAFLSQAVRVGALSLPVGPSPDLLMAKYLERKSLVTIIDWKMTPTPLGVRAVSSPSRLTLCGTGVLVRRADLERSGDN